MIRHCTPGLAFLLLLPASVPAANAPFQEFFFGVCGGATGTLALRCGETTGSLGNLSGDSESSLNPSQNLAHNLAPVSAAAARSKESRERGEKLRDEALDASDGVKVQIGPVSLLLNVQGAAFERSLSDQEVAAGARAFDGESRAIEAGLDYRMSDTMVLGALVGVEKYDYDFDPEAPGRNFTPANRAGDAEASNVFLTVFASKMIGTGGYVDVTVGYEAQDATYRRNSVFQESTRTIAQTDVRVRGDTQGTTLWASLNAGYDFARGSSSFGPYAGVTWTDSDIDAYRETDLSNSGLAMRFGKTSNSSLLGHAGLRFSHSISTGWGVVMPQARLEYQHEFEDDPAEATARYVLDGSGRTYSLTGDGVDRDFMNAGLSAALIMKNGWMTFVDASILLDNENFDRTRVTVGLRKEF